MQKKIDMQKGEINKSTVRIVIKRLLANKIPVEIAEFDAVQEKEGYNLVLVGDNGKFREDLEIIKHDIITFYKDKLKLMSEGMTREQKIKVVKEKIRQQEELVKKIKDGEIKNEIKEVKNDKDVVITKRANIIDEQNKLTAFKVLLYDIENEGEGSYEIINLGGQREKHFLYMDGMLYPYFHRATDLTLHPDIATKRKHHRSEQLLLDRDLTEETKSVFTGVFLNIMKVLFIVLFALTIIWSSNVNKKAIEIADQYDKAITLSQDCVSVARSFILNETEDSIVRRQKKRDNGFGTDDLIDLTKKMIQ